MHCSGRPHECPGCDRGFTGTASIWRQLLSVHNIEHSKILGNGVAGKPWSQVHRTQEDENNVYQQYWDDHKSGEECKPYGNSVQCVAKAAMNLMCFPSTRGSTGKSHHPLMLVLQKSHC